MSHPTILRAHSIVLIAGADTKRDLARELRHMADLIEREQLTVGCSGGPSAGTTYSYRVSPEQTHDRYFEQVNAWLDAERAKRED